jgi:hypothetical protein
MSSGAGRHGRGTVADAAEQQGWSPSPRPARASGDGRALTALRVVTYVLTSLASVLLIASAVYGAVQLNRLADALQGFGGGPSSASSTTSPLDEGVPPQELSSYCLEAPADPACAG